MNKEANKQTSKRADKEICFVVFDKYIKQRVKSPCLLIQQISLSARLLVNLSAYMLVSS